MANIASNPRIFSGGVGVDAEHSGFGSHGSFLSVPATIFPRDISRGSFLELHIFCFNYGEEPRSSDWPLQDTTTSKLRKSRRSMRKMSGYGLTGLTPKGLLGYSGEKVEKGMESSQKSK